MCDNTKFFENPFPDYSFTNADSLISVNKINPSNRIVTALASKWEQTVCKFKSITFSDTSVYIGSSGIALLKLLRNPKDTDNLYQIKSLLCLNDLKMRRHSFLCGDAGPLAIGAVVCHKLGETDEVNKLIDRLLSMKGPVLDHNSDLPNEYLYGRAGYLYALMYVNKNIESCPVSEGLIRAVIETILECGQIEAKASKFKSPLMYQWHCSYYLGAAHGISGILYLLLQAREYLTDTELNFLIKPTVDYLATLKFKSYNYPSSIGNKDDKYIQWCHGAPGFVYLFSTAFKVFHDPRYLELALLAAEQVWQRGLVKKGYSICHGVSGNAYCFLQLYQTTENEQHLYRALKFTEWCMDYNRLHEEHHPDRPLSLFEGAAGPMYLLLDIQHPMEAKFPGFTL